MTGQSIVNWEQYLPAIFRSANQRSLESQRHYTRLVSVGLVLVVGSSAAAMAPLADYALARWLVFLCLVAGVALPAIAVGLNLKEDWYLGRAVAESVKSLWWSRFARAGEFGEQTSEAERDELFRDKLKNILAETTRLGLVLPPAAPPAEPVTLPGATTVSGRFEAYVTYRLRDQARWYSQKANINAAAGRRGWVEYVVANALLLVLGAWEVFRPGEGLGVTGPVGALAASILAWIELKRFEELSKSYAVAAHELELILDKATKMSPSDLPRLVEEAEKAMSREHTLWIVRRTQRLDR